MKRLAIITARSGSKGLPDKNIMDLCGKPLMVYSIEAAIESGLFDRVIVSTDSEKYADIARAAGADVMMRGETLSNDTATSFMVIEDVLNRVDEQYDYFMLFQPTSPFRTVKHVKDACELFEKNTDRVDFLVSMKAAETRSAFINPIEEDGLLKHFNANFANYRRQNGTEYQANGAIYIAKPQQYLEQQHFMGERSLAYIMSAEDSVDIDIALDFDIATLLMQRRIEKEKGVK